ncbi:(S)-2-hydroxy-acid oxidase [Maricaulis maris MCS10]|jgi:L-lactate dehydrogenase (cytochrome)|uniref:(S)-2-hydroxy-acid oxidase n=1 Tax=Maricaulis maris (strain MCS10) TaxID=394221 RepID=Q0AMS8_MARMM|nr:alpha-hydroxy acid oxidase [Maricaulis maris]ABI66409.1 (S)-2-hydroxy-acid oxidase [Maricaulis maris MCS10]
MTAIENAHNIEALRALARKRLPRMVFDYIDGGADDEITLGRNDRRYGDYELNFKSLVDISKIELETTVMGATSKAPIIVTPTAAQRLFNPRAGEAAVARAARKAGLVYCLSTLASTTIEDIARHTDGPKWFQVYVWKDRAIVEKAMERAKAAGFTGLILTVDVPVAGNRERDHLNAFTIPPKINAKTVSQVLARPGYLWDMATTPKILAANWADMDTGGMGIIQFLDSQFDRTVTWEDAKWMKEAWGGPFAIKGIARPDDALRCVHAGADAVWISNHGGRQLDTAPATIDTLADIVAAVDGQAEVILDGGIRRGTDIIKALALGATAVAVGRPYLFGLGAGGQAGVERALDILVSALERDMALVGATRLSDLTPDFVRMPR